MQKIIGGNHGLPSQNEGKIFKPLSKITLTNARSCLYSILKYLNMPTIWMPSYLCESLLHTEYAVKFYEIDKTLNINESFLSELKPSDAVLIIDYFGFVQNELIYKAIRSKGCISIEDASQSLFSEKHNTADFIFYSLTKCLGLPDGGMIEAKDTSFKVEVEPCPEDYIKTALSYRTKRAKFDEGENNDWYQEYLSHKKMTTPVGKFEMTEISKSLYGTYNQFNIMQKTRNNYMLLQRHLTPIKKLQENTCPIGFPIIHERRDELLSELIKQQIYPPIHWKLKQVPQKYSDSYWLTKRELTLPCDYRYDEQDMERIIKCVKTL